MGAAAAAVHDLDVGEDLDRDRQGPLHVCALGEGGHSIGRSQDHLYPRRADSVWTQPPSHRAAGAIGWAAARRNWLRVASHRLLHVGCATTHPWGRSLFGRFFSRALY